MKKYNTIKSAYALVQKHKITNWLFGWALYKMLVWYK